MEQPLSPKTISEVQEIVKDGLESHINQAGRVIPSPACWLPRGGGTKPALSTPTQGVGSLDLKDICGVVEYQPDEFIFTALAGTRLAEVNQLLGSQGQYLPFDPPLAERGATLGGTVASGLSGPGRTHYGGVRDFLIGVQFVDGKGHLIRGGGKVVKNSAGFDIPKLMVGSIGRLGVLIELSFKVFPRPKSFMTLRVNYDRLEQALEGLYILNSTPMEFEGIDLQPGPHGYLLWVRLGGIDQALPERVRRIQSLLGGGDILIEAQEAEVWRVAREFEWVPEGWSLVKVPLTPRRIINLEHEIIDRGWSRRYSAGGQVGWIALPEPRGALKEVLLAQNLFGLVLFGFAGEPRLGLHPGQGFLRRVKQALDPAGRWLDYR